MYCKEQDKVFQFHNIMLCIYSGLKNRCNVWLFCIACDVELNCVGITLSAGRVD